MKSVFRNVMTDLRTIYTDSWFLSDENLSTTLDTWYKALSNLTYDQLRRAVDEYIAHNDKPPMPSQIREIALSQTETQQTTFDPEAFWQQFDYWVLTDLQGYHMNEIIAEAGDTADSIAEYFKKLGQDMNGTVLKKVDFATYKPKYIPAPEPTEEAILQTFAPIEPLVTAPPRLETPEKITAFETRRRQMLDQAALFTEKETNI